MRHKLIRLRSCLLQKNSPQMISLYWAFVSFCQLCTFILVLMPSNNWKTKRWPIVVVIVVVVVKHSISALLRRAQCPARTSEIIVRGSDHGANNGIGRDPAAQRGILTPAKSCRLERASGVGAPRRAGEGLGGISSREDLSVHSTPTLSQLHLAQRSLALTRRRPMKTSTNIWKSQPIPALYPWVVGVALPSTHITVLLLTIREGEGLGWEWGRGPWSVFYRDFIRGEKWEEKKAKLPSVHLHYWM